MPVATCYKILDLYLWSFAGFGVVGVGFVGFTNAGKIAHVPLYWIAAAAVLAQSIAAILRGLPFLLRYSVFAGGALIFIFAAATILGLTPNWAFAVLMLLSSFGLFFGTRAGLIASLGLCLLHIVIGWCWTIGYLPWLTGGAKQSLGYSDFTLGVVWIRVLVITAGLLAAMQLLMRYVLNDLNNALKETNVTLQRLAAEQELRARAEEARMKAELAVREAQKFDALGRLASGVAHDFNNVLCVMKCWSSFLADEAREPIVAEAVTAIQRATENAEQLTHHLLAFGRGDPGKREVSDLAEIVRLEGRTLGRLLPRNVQVTVEAAEPIHVQLASGQLQEIILNLAINARDAMPHGGKLALRVTTETRQLPAAGLAAGRFARLEIEDTGGGMDEETQRRMFEPFFTTKVIGKGTGLGLAMVYGLVTGAGGSIDVKSAPGRGTKFTIFLPAANLGELRPEPLQTAILNPTRCRVLIALAQPEIRLLVERVLAREGFPLMVVPDGAGVLTAITGGKFGLLIVDGVLPDLLSVDVIEQVLASSPECRVLIASVNMQDKALLSGIDSGRFQHLSKPFSSGQLRQAVNVVLAGRVD